MPPVAGASEDATTWRDRNLIVVVVVVVVVAYGCVSAR